MKNLVKTLILVIILQMILQFVFVLPLALTLGNRIKSDSLFEMITSLILFAIALFISMKILKVKKQNLDFKLLSIRLAAVYFAGGVLTFFMSGFSLTQLVGYPILAFLISNLYLKKTEL